MRRRDFLKISACAAATAAGIAPAIGNARLSRRVIVLGFDGMDPQLVQRFMREGDMPAFQDAIGRGFHFGELQTTMPPQSPVAWSSFITGTNPGGHGIFDFIHRDPKSFTPYMSTSRSYPASSAVALGGWNLPLGSGSVELMRRGPALWTPLEEHGIPASLFQLPANFPVVEGESRAISGMGTPDLRGTYGTFTYFSDDPRTPTRKQVEGGVFFRVTGKDHRYDLELEGPPNPFRRSAAALPFTVFRDPTEKLVRLLLADQEFILQQGEWSEWIPISFELLPLFASVAGMVRIYVKEVHPYLKLYLSPINVDPLNPSLPICSPRGYSRELSQAVGRFYTQGFPADTKALSAGALSNGEYLHQAKLVMDENERMFHYQLERFREGLFFFYFSNVDQNSHMLWRNMDPTHPLYEPNESAEVKGAVRYFYRKMDSFLGAALRRLDSSTALVALSDHGFAPFSREFHLSRWLVENGFTVLRDPEGSSPGEFYDRVDWSRTRAYALGLNGIYVNLADREPHGIVSPRERDTVKREVIAKLSTVVDPDRGVPVVTRAYDASELYSGPFMDLSPDVVVGYHRGYRISDESVLGKFPAQLVSDRRDKWAADHCLDPSVVPGILLTNLPVHRTGAGIWDLAPTILHAFGLNVPAEMTGRPI